MDDRFRPAEAAITEGDLDRFEQLLAADPELATARSGCSHPTLLQCLVLTVTADPRLERSIKALADRGAELNDPLIAAPGSNNVRAINALLDLGAAIDGNGNWSPLEECLYWGTQDPIAVLLKRGAAVDSLRKAAGLGRMDYVLNCFTDSGALTPAAGCIRWPWFTKPIPDAIKFDRQQIIDNALIYAAAWGQIEVAGELLTRGAQVNALPAGFDFTGTPLHYAALQGRSEMINFLLAHGADLAARDNKVNNTPAGWADYGGHKQLSTHLEGLRLSRGS